MRAMQRIAHIAHSASRITSAVLSCVAPDNSHAHAHHFCCVAPGSGSRALALSRSRALAICTLHCMYFMSSLGPCALGSELRALAHMALPGSAWLWLPARSLELGARSRSAGSWELGAGSGRAPRSLANATRCSIATRTPANSARVATLNAVILLHSCNLRFTHRLCWSWRPVVWQHR
jgi:hypothetical protein